MISLDNTKNVIISFIAACSGDTCLSVMDNACTIPNYSISKQKSHFCLLATREKQIGKKCVIFYNSLKEGSAKSVCPFGFDVIYSKIKIGRKQIILYGLLSKNDNILSNEINKLPRKTKKIAQRIIANNPVEFPKDETFQFFSLCSDTLNTLLAGRVGASIRSLSHHILTPIQGANADIENIKVYDESKTQFERLKRNLAEINDTSKRIQLLLAEQSDFNTNRVRRVTVHFVVDQIISQLQSAAEKERIVFNQSFNGVSVTIEAIPDQIFIALQNLLQNALKYSHTGFADKNNSIDITYSLYNDNFLKIDICNIGCGITQQEIESEELFELGFRGELSNDRERTGSGCGLYISHMIATAHGGKILVQSVPIRKSNSDAQAYKTNVGLVIPIIQT